MSFQGSARTIRKQLIKRDGVNCFYCGIKTAMPETGQSVLKSDNCTIEHLYHNFDIRRLLVKHNREHLRICCYGCNQKKDREIKLSVFGGAYNFKETDYVGVIIMLAKYWIRGDEASDKDLVNQIDN